jgi:hypothetical protein
MRSTKVWLAVMFVAGAVAGPMVARAVSPAVVAAGPEEHDHWCNFDGHWSYWCVADRCWYYTDGHHWFMHDGKHWTAYKFDRSFGKEHFVKGEYKIPGEEVKVYAPRHEVRVYK